MSKERKILIVLCCTALIFMSAMVGRYVFSANASSDFPVFSSGAEAVMTFPAGVINGLSDDGSPGDEMYYPLGITFSDSALVVADMLNDRIQIIENGIMSRVGKAGSSGISFAVSGGFTDGYRKDAEFRKPADVAVSDGNIIVADSGNNAIRKITKTMVVSIAGGQGAGYADGREGEALFNSPQGVAVSGDHIYVADTLNHCIRMIDRSGNVTLYAGIPEKSGYADGSVYEAMFFEPCQIRFGNDGALYVADSANHAIRKIENGMVSTVAGIPGVPDSVTGYSSGGFADGANSEALFRFPRALAVTDSGDIYVADTMNHSVRLISDGSTYTVLGNGEAGKFYGSAENLQLSKPSGIAFHDGNLYIADSLNNAVITIPVTAKLNEGRPLRDEILTQTGIDTATKYAYDGEIRIFADGVRVKSDKAKPQKSEERIYIPVIKLFEALGAIVVLGEDNATLSVEIDGLVTVMELNRSYYMTRGTAVMPLDEIKRLFPYICEWYPEYSVISIVRGNID